MRHFLLPPLFSNQYLRSSVKWVNLINSDNNWLLNIFPPLFALVQPVDAHRAQTPCFVALAPPKKDAGQCAALRHLGYAGIAYRRRENLPSPTDARQAFPPTVTNEGYSLRKRYNESREPLQDCRCEKARGETAVVAILLLLPSPSARAVFLHN